MEQFYKNIAIIFISVLLLLVLYFLYRRYKQSEKLSKIRRSINKYFTKNEVVFKSASGQIDQNCSDRVKVGQMSTNEAFANIFEETHISQPSTKQTTLDLSVDDEDNKQEPDFNKVFQKTQSKPKISKLRKRLANKVKVVEQEKKEEQNSFHNVDGDDDIAIE